MPILRGHPSRTNIGINFSEDTNNAYASNPGAGNVLGTPRRDFRTYDYDAVRHGPDSPYAGAGPNARVWHMYAGEVMAYDLDTVNGWKDNLDVFLVFVGLFSTIVTSFLVQSSQALQDFGMINASLLIELIAVQRAVVSGLSPEDIPPSPYSGDSRTGQTIDIVVNALWIASLTISLASALVAVLAKQWLHHYAAAASGTQRDRVLLQQCRFMALEQWHIPFIVGMLPLMLHVSLFLFWAGLASLRSYPAPHWCST